MPIFASTCPPQLTGINDLERALRKLRETHDGVLCVTLGDRGAMALEGDRSITSRRSWCTPLDTTGAGDVFRGGFIYAAPRPADGRDSPLRQRRRRGELHAPGRARRHPRAR